MKGKIRFFYVLLALALGLTACGEKKEVRKVNWVNAPAYEAEDIALPVQTGDLLGCCTDGEYMYIRVDTEEEEVKSHLLRVSLADGEAVELDGYEDSVVPDDGFKNTLGPVLAPDGTMWLYEMWTITYYDLPEDFDPAKEAKGQYITGRENFHHLRQLDTATGRQKKLVDLSDAVRTLDVSDGFDIAGFAVDGRGNIYFAGTGGVAVMDGRGKYLFTLEASLPNTDFDGTSGGPLALLPDGSVAALTIQPGGKRTVRPIDVSAKSWGAERYELAGGVDLLYGGSNGFLFYYVTGGVLYAWEPEGTEGRVLLSWSDAELTSGAMAFAPLDGGKLAALTRTYPNGFGWYDGEIRLLLLSPLDKAPSDGKTKLVFGTIGTHDVHQKKIREFNQSNDRYYIELRNYAGEGIMVYDVTETGRENALKLLNAEVAAGQGPDIWDTTLPIDLYARKGVLEDLQPYIDSDPEIDLDALLGHVLECAAVDGKLYSVFNSFSIQTAAVSRELWGDKDSWTLAELLANRKKMQEGGTIFGYGVGDVDTLRYLLEENLDYWVDWTSGTCRFDSDEFRELLEICKAEGPSIPWDDRDAEKVSDALDGADLRAGRQLLIPASLTGPEELILYDAMFAGPEHLTDYLGYMNDNDVWFGHSVCPFYSQALVNAEITKTQGAYGSQRLADDAVFGALDHGGYAGYVGYPTGGGSGSSFVLPGPYSTRFDARWAISASCRDKEAAWSFVRQLLLPGGLERDKMATPGIPTHYITTNQFPLYKEEFEWMFAPQYITSRKSDNVYAYDKEGNIMEDPKWTIPIPDSGKPGGGHLPITMFIQGLAPDEAQLEQFWNLYNSIDHVCVEDSVLMDVIMEQAQPYFAGDKSAEETADLIQRRATLYVNENM